MVEGDLNDGCNGYKGDLNNGYKVILMTVTR